MSAVIKVALTSAALSGVLLASSPSFAHIDLASPTPRVGGMPDTYLKTGPCGQQANGRVDANVSVFSPGETITLVWDEYIQHPSYYRIAVDLNGDDSFTDRNPTGVDAASDDPTQLTAGDDEIILEYIKDLDPTSNHFEVEVTLPNQPCESCTLQVIQFMYNSSPARSTYYQCVDLVLQENGAMAGSAGSGTGGSGSVDTAGASGNGGSSSTSAGASGTAGEESVTAGASSVNPMGEGEESVDDSPGTAADDGCSLNAPDRSEGIGAASLLALCAALVGRRRR